MRKQSEVSSLGLPAAEALPPFAVNLFVPPGWMALARGSSRRSLGASGYGWLWGMCLAHGRLPTRPEVQGHSRSGVTRTPVGRLALP